MELTHKHPYTIKAVKTFRGHEGEPCAQGKLYKGSKAVCHWSEDSWGGSMNFQVIDQTLFDEFQDYCKEQKFYFTHAGKQMELTHEKDSLVIDEILKVMENIKWAKKHTKKSVLAKLDGDGADGWSCFSIPAGRTAQEVINAVRGRHGNDTVILNELV